MNFHYVPAQRPFISVDGAWLAVLKQLVDRGQKMSSRIGSCIELLGFSTVLEDVERTWLTNPLRSADPVFAAAEVLWYLSGQQDPSMVEAYAPGYRKYVGDAYGAYGRRIVGNAYLTECDALQLLGTRDAITYQFLSQLRGVVDLLRAKPDSRQAVVSLWRESDLAHAQAGDKLDLPCTLTLQYLVRGGRLCAITNMRSQDVWMGLPYDCFAFTVLQRLVAAALDLRPGFYVHQSGSVHLYEKHLTRALDALNSEFKEPLQERLIHPHDWRWPSGLDMWQHAAAAVKLEDQARASALDWEAAAMHRDAGTVLSDLVSLVVLKNGQGVRSTMMRLAASRRDGAKAAKTEVTP